MQLNSTDVATHCIKEINCRVLYKLTSNESNFKRNYSSYDIATNLDHYKI